jgi:hypothetical protein
MNPTATSAQRHRLRSIHDVFEPTAMGHVGLLIRPMRVYEKTHIGHQQGISPAQRSQVLIFGDRREVRRLMLDAALTLPKGHHPKARYFRFPGLARAAKTLPQGVLDEAA